MSETVKQELKHEWVFPDLFKNIKYFIYTNTFLPIWNFCGLEHILWFNLGHILKSLITFNF